MSLPALLTVFLQEGWPPVSWAIRLCRYGIPRHGGSLCMSLHEHILMVWCGQTSVGSVPLKVVFRINPFDQSAAQQTLQNCVQLVGTLAVQSFPTDVAPAP